MEGRVSWTLYKRYGIEQMVQMINKQWFGGAILIAS